MFTVYVYCTLFNIIACCLWQIQQYRVCKAADTPAGALLFLGWIIGVVLSFTGPVFTVLGILNIALALGCQWWLKRQVAAGKSL